MLPLLNPLKKSIWLLSSLFVLASGIFAIALFYLLGNVLGLEDIYVLTLTGLAVLIIAIVSGNLIASQSMLATDFLGKAILLVTREDNQVDAPDINKLDASKDFLSKLASDIYDLSQNKPSTDQNAEYRLSFYTTLANQIALPIIGLDKEKLICFANNSAVEYVNSNIEDCIGKPFYDVFNLSFVSEYTLESWLNKNSDQTVAKTEAWSRVRLNLENNEMKQFDMVAKYSNDNSFGLETVLALFDYTNKYDKDDSDLSFVSLAAHELRGPLTIVRGYLEVFEDELGDNLNSEQKKFMSNMSASAEQLTAFAANILNVARVEENSLSLNLKECSWPEVLTASCKDMELRAGVHGKHIVYEVSNDLPTVAVDKISIYEVLSNLIDNAIKYTHTDDGIIVKSYLKDGMVETTVTDKGVGISESIISHIFDKFYRAHQNKNSVGGTGLGLYLSKAIISAHGGTIWVKSKEGEGSTFGFSLPLYASVAEQIKSEDNGSIVRGAHGWIKNHSLYRE